MAGVKQFSMNAEDRVGALAELTRGLAHEGVNIRGIFISESEGKGTIRFVVDDPVKAERVLVEENLEHRIEPVLALEMPNAPGALHTVAKILADNKINIEYVYTLLPRTPLAIVILEVSSIEDAAKVLKEGGIKVLGDQDL